MTLTAEQSSNKAKYESAPTAEIIDIIRTAMGEGCIRPSHVFDAVDELICRIQALENSPKRNCDVGTVEEQYARVRAFCKRHKVGLRCVDCPVNGVLPKNCALIWAQMPYVQEGGSK